MSFPNYSTFFKLGLLTPGCSAPQPKKEGKRPLRSFLKLDLVDQASCEFPAVEPPSPVTSCASSPCSSPLLRPSPTPSHMALPHSSLVHRRSRDSLRAMPSPKPAPLASLPIAPNTQAPSCVAPSEDSTPATTPLPPITPGSALGLHDMGRPVSAYSAAVSSVASPRRRLVNRTQALAFLEGRTPSRKRKSRPRARNFMSMSDDEDEDADAELDFPMPSFISSRAVLSPSSAPALNLSFLSLTKGRPLSTASLPASTRSRNFLDFCADWDAEDEQRPLSLSPTGTIELGHWRSFIEIEMAGGA